MNRWIKVIDDILQYQAVDRSANKSGYSFLKKNKHIWTFGSRLRF